MDFINTPAGPKLIGIGEAVVVAVRTDPNSVAHQVKINHPDFGETTYIAYIPPAGLYRVPRIGDTCFVFCNENFHQYPVAWGHRISPQLASELLGNRADNVTVLYSSGENNDSVSHKITLDDGANKGIRVESAAGHSVNLNDASTIEVTHKDGAKLTLTGETITLNAGGSTFSVGPEGIRVVSAQGSTLDVNDTITGVATDGRSTFDQTGVATHRHIGNLGYPTTSPITGT